MDRTRQRTLNIIESKLWEPDVHGGSETDELYVNNNNLRSVRYDGRWNVIVDGPDENGLRTVRPDMRWEAIERSKYEPLPTDFTYYKEDILQSDKAKSALSEILDYRKVDSSDSDSYSSDDGEDMKGPGTPEEESTLEVVLGDIKRVVVKGNRRNMEILGEQLAKVLTPDAELDRQRADSNSKQKVHAELWGKVNHEFKFSPHLFMTEIRGTTLKKVPYKDGYRIQRVMAVGDNKEFEQYNATGMEYREFLKKYDVRGTVVMKRRDEVTYYNDLNTQNKNVKKQ